MRTPVLVMCLVAGLVGGCSSVGDRGRAAADTARSFLQAVADGDGATACAALAPDTAAEVEQSSGQTCAQGILSEDLPAPAPVTASEVYGQRALVRLGGETVFLGVFEPGWRVVAAGCTARGEKPYDCLVEG